jgi:phosphate/sulfate permease
MPHQISFSTTDTSIASTRHGIKDAVPGKLSNKAIGVIVVAGCVIPVVGAIVAFTIYKIYQTLRNEPKKQKELYEEACKETYTKVTLNAQKERTIAYKLDNGTQVTYTEQVRGSGTQKTSELWMEKDGVLRQHHFNSIAELQAFRRNDIRVHGQEYSAILPNELQAYLNEAKRHANSDPVMELEEVYHEAIANITVNSQNQPTLTYALSNGITVEYTEEKDGLKCYHLGGLHSGLQDKEDDFPKTIAELQNLRRSSIAKEHALYEPPLSQVNNDSLQALWIKAQGFSQLAEYNESKEIGHSNDLNHANSTNVLSSSGANTRLTLSEDFKRQYGLEDQDFAATERYLESVKQVNNKITVDALQFLKLAILHNKLSETGYIDFTGADFDTLLQIADQLYKDINLNNTTSGATPLEELLGIILDDCCSKFCVPDYIGWFDTLANVYGVKELNLVEESEEIIRSQWDPKEMNSVDFFKYAINLTEVPMTVVYQGKISAIESDDIDYGIDQQNTIARLNILEKFEGGVPKFQKLDNVRLMKIDNFVLIKGNNGEVRIENLKNGLKVKADNRTSDGFTQLLAIAEQDGSVSSTLLMDLIKSVEEFTLSLITAEEIAFTLLGDISIGTTTQQNKDLAALLFIYADFQAAIVTDKVFGTEERIGACVEYLNNKPKQLEALRTIYTSDEQTRKKIFNNYGTFCEKSIKSSFGDDPLKSKLFGHMNSAVTTLYAAMIDKEIKQ